MKRNPQLDLLKKQPKAYGGELLKTRKGRAHGRPLDTKHSMHLVLRSTKAKGKHSFWQRENKLAIRRVTMQFAMKYGVKILSMANVGNHLHFHIKLSNRFTYFKFIRALTSAIAMAVYGTSRWNPSGARENRRDPSAAKVKDCFWDYRPFTRVILGIRSFLHLKDYIEVNQLEGFGLRRGQARFLLKWIGTG